MSTKAPSDAIVVKDAHLLFNGDFKRTGLDLVISRDDQELVLPDYFKGDKRAPLASPDGAYLTGKTIDALTGHVQVAQADGSVAAAKIIGHVTKLSGSATVVRNGVSIVLNNGDTVYQGDVVQSGSNSTLGITFIDGSVFGLASNARMVLNEMVYDPNGSGNSSFLTLVQGTISFVAGATAKQGDMKVDTPVATMGIRGTAVLAEIDFEVTVPGTVPPVRFQVLVEPDGTTGSYVLMDRVTLAPIATVNQAGTVTTVSGAGAVSFLASAQLSPELMKLISEVFSQKFTDNTNPKSNTNFTDTVIPQTTFPVQFAGGETGTATVTVIAASEGTSGAPVPQPKAPDRIPGPPGVVAFNKALAERPALTGSSLPDTTSGAVSYTDINPGDVPTVSTAFNSFAYANAAGVNVTSTLTSAQLGAIAAVSVPLTVVQDPAGKNNGTATWTYDVEDNALDFLAQGEKLTLTYMARVDNNFAPANEFSLAPFTITITGTNDTPTMSVTDGSFTELENASQPNPTGSAALDTVIGTVTFEDVDLTDTHQVTILSVSASGVTGGVPANATMLAWLSLGALIDSTDGVIGSTNWTFSAQDHHFDYLADGEQLVLTYTIEVDDGHGGVVTKPVTITVTGTNDTPVVTTTDGAFVEQSNPTQPNPTGSPAEDTVTGSVSFTDVDLSDSHAVTIKSVSAAGVTGGVPGNATMLAWLSLGAVTDSINGATGSTNWTFTAQDHYFDYLADGEELVLTYTIEVDDGHGGVVTKPVTITVTGTNDTPVFNGDQEASIDERTDTQGSTALDTANGTINFSDVDLSDTHTLTVTGVVATETTSGLTTVPGTVLSWLSLQDLTYTTGGGLGSQNWSFSAEDHYFDYLAEGESVTLTYTVEIDDGNGGITTQEVTVTINGSNDEPQTNSGAQAATLYEIANTQGSTTPEEANGAVTFTDLDWSDLHVNLDTVEISGTASGLPAPLTVQSWLTLGAFTESSNGTTGSQAWSFSAEDHYFDYLAGGESVTLTYTVEIDDGNGGTDAQDVTITVYGSNDAPVIASAPGDSFGELPDTTGSSAADTASGTVTFTDLDLSDRPVVSASFASYAYTDASLQVHFLTSPQAAAIEAALTVTQGGGNTNNGSANWSYSVPDNAFDFLTEGDTLVLTYTVSVYDGHTAVTTPITITVTGSNDDPVVSAALIDGVNEGDTVFTKDLLTGASDVDRGETETLSVTNVSYTVGAGSPTSVLPPGVSRTGNTLSVDPGDPAFDYLAVGEPLDIVVSYDVIDVHGAIVHQTETITITGTNDEPAITSNGGGTTASVSVAENTMAVTTVQATDVDSATVTYSLVTGAGSPDQAKFAIDANTGALSFIAAPDYENPTDLDHNNSYVIQVQASDGAGGVDIQTITVNVTDAVEGPSFIVTSALDDGGSGTLRAAINFANANPGTTITFANNIANQTITLASELPLITGDGTVIDGGSNNITISGNDQFRIFFVGDNTLTVGVTIESLTLADGAAKGGNGASGGGGGAGFGGAVFVSNHASLSLINTSLTSNSAAGGNGAAGIIDAGGGGGGMGGNGGVGGDNGSLGTNSGGGGGGGFGVGADGGGPYVTGAAGAFSGGASGGTGGAYSGGTAAGGANGGGGGGGGYAGGGGGGGVGGSNGAAYIGGNGGFGGGGGGAAGVGALPAGNGGFGGGGGSSGVTGSAGGNGGFGGGGGANGDGGFGGGDGGVGSPSNSPYPNSNNVGGGGGAGMGGGVFVEGGGSLTIGGTLEINGNTVTGGSGAGSGVGLGGNGSAFGSGIFLQGSSGTIAFAPGAGQTATIADAIADQSGSGGTGGDAGVYALVLDGAGKLVLSGTNTYTGATMIVEGTLQVDGSIANSAVTVQDGGTLGGNGTTGAVTLQSGATLAPGASAGLLDTGNLSLAAGTTLAVELGGASAGAGGYDQLHVSGTVNLNGATLSASLINAFDPTSGTFTIIDNDGTSDAVSGTFAGLAEGATFALGGQDYQISYVGGDGNDVTLTVATPQASMQLVAETFLGGAGNQAATDVFYANGHLYLTYNAPITQTAADNSTVVTFDTGVDGATQSFSQQWAYGFFNGVAADTSNIYAVGANHPTDHPVGGALTVDGGGDPEVKTILVEFNSNGTAGSNPAPANDYAANNFFGYSGVEIFQNVLVTTQSGETVVYAVGFGQPFSYGAYIIAAYDSDGNLLHTATDSMPYPSYSIANDAIEFNGSIWAVGNSWNPSAGDASNVATVWTASHDLTSVVAHQVDTGSAGANFASAAVLDNALYAVGNVTSNGGDYLIAKYNSDGDVVWSTIFGGTEEEKLSGVVVLDNHLYVVGSASNGIDADGVLMEIDPTDGSVISTTTYGGDEVDSFSSITTDGDYLYVAGQSKSFANGGNSVGDSDAILVTYAPMFGPEIKTDGFTVTENVDGTTTVAGVYVADTDATASVDTFHMTAVTAEAPDSGVTPDGDTGLLANINSTLSEGVTYDPGSSPPETDMVTLTVTDGYGHSDVVNFVFYQEGPGPVTLTGTDGKDVIFATGYDDTLTGGAKADQFVFTPEDAGGADIITDFAFLEDRIDLRGFASIVSEDDFVSWFNDNVTQSTTDPDDVVITVGSNQTITLKDVELADLTASNFIVSQQLSL